MRDSFEFGLDSPVYLTDNGAGGLIDGPQAVRDVVAQAVLADRVGIDSFNMGEHYRDDQMNTAPSVLLAGIAGQTERIRVGTAVTVLSTQDSVRVFHDFSTLDAISNGRAQLIVGRGSASESFPLFGYDLADYEELFDEKLDLFVRLLREKNVTWSGRFRPPLQGQTLNPPIPEGHLPTWVGVGGSPQSVVRAARYDLPVIFAIIGGHPSRFAGHIDLYRRALAQFGHAPKRVGMHSPGLIADTDEEAREIQWGYWRDILERENKIRGWRVPTYDQFLSEVEQGSFYVGSPDTVARRLAETIALMDVDRFDLVYAPGAVPHEVRMRNIELYGTEVIPRIKHLLGMPAETAAVPA